jgi:solute carrier family 35 protein F1/2
MWGFLINGIQASALEWREMKEVPWDGKISKQLSSMSKV